MKCQKCNQNEANTHITKIVNGKKMERYLCESCAAENNEILNIKASFDNEFDDFFSGFFGNPYIKTEKKRNIASGKTCSLCGTNLNEITDKGRLGCSECYKTFKDFLLTPLRQIHGANRHIGKIPKRAGKDLRKANKIDEMQSELDRAVMEQNFERAAELRDKINDLKNSAQ